MRTRMSALIVALTVILSGMASAQETSGTLTGRLVDTQGLVLMAEVHSANIQEREGIKRNHGP